MPVFPDDVPMAAEFTRAARTLGGRPDGWVLAYHPVARMNPFQSILYSMASASGFAPVGVIRRSELSALPSVLALGVGAAVHLHWTSDVVGDAESVESAEANSSEFLRLVEGLREAGVRLVWTVHNRLPHACRYPEVECRMRSRLAALADAIHIMNPMTPQEVAGLYELPDERLLTIPHPSYVGAYPSHHDRQLARFELGFDPDDFVAGLIGSIQPYKGTEDFIQAVADPSLLGKRLRAVVAGIPGQDAASRAIVNRLERMEIVRSLPFKLDDSTLARLLSALDVMVLPYRTTLNSGVALLALTFGVPIVAPASGPFLELARLGFCLTYEPDSIQSLRNSLAAAPEFCDAVNAEAMRQYVESLHGSVISHRFFGELRRMLDAQ